MTIIKLPLTKEIDEHDFVDTPLNETLVRDLASGGFSKQQRNVALVAGTGTKAGTSRPERDRRKPVDPIRQRNPKPTPPLASYPNIRGKQS